MGRLWGDFQAVHGIWQGIDRGRLWGGFQVLHGIWQGIDREENEIKTFKEEMIGIIGKVREVQRWANGVGQSSIN